MKNIKIFVRSGLVLALALVFSSCMLVPFINAFHEAGATSADRMRLFSQDVKDFWDALRMGRSGKALGFLEPPSKDTQELFAQTKKAVTDDIRKVSRSEQIVDSKVDVVDFSEDAYEASVEMRVRYFAIPYYVVNERLVKEKWKFSFSKGWKLLEHGPVEIKAG